ncbi:MAG: polyribonucleotide nucleotidyltransferase [Bacteriovoracaceae bacterium]
MLNNKHVYTLNYGGKEVTVETGRLAKQADGSVLVSSEGTQVLVTVCSAREVKDGQDFFPLLVEYTEKFYSAGKFLGGFLKREGRPSVKETLNARLIDRPLRPLFPEGYMFDTVVSCTVMSYTGKGDPEILAGLGASAALCLSDIPFEGPIGTCKVARIDGKMVINPDHDQWENSDFEIAVAASQDAILMVEGEANIVPEAEILEAINFAHDNIREYCNFVKDIQAKHGKAKRPFQSAEANEACINKVKELYNGDVRKCLEVTDKMERGGSIRELKKKIIAAAEAAPADFALREDDAIKKEIGKAIEEVLYEVMRNDILLEEKRIGGRKLDEVREIEVETNILETPHGSSLFTRGETQVLSTVTLGGNQGEQMSDRIVGTNFDKFYLHYNFPPYSVGEARGVRGVGRREQGHGNLAERAIKPVVPGPDDGYPYTTRVVCEVLESNGSSSMGSVCSGSMALMDAGVPIKEPVAGIAMGLISEGDKFTILSDILGDEDHLGDMDFKVAGTKTGITAIQMDIKITGITNEIMTKAIEQAHVGRLHILSEMEKAITAHRDDYKDHVPRMTSFKLEQDQIGAIIGPGGKIIKKIQEDFGVTLEIEDDGTVKVLGDNKEQVDACIAYSLLTVNGPEIGAEYEATVVTIKEYGAFVDIIPGVSGLVHISEFADERVSDPNEYVSEGDKIKIQVLEVDRMGRFKLSAKAVQSLTKKEA